MLAEHSQDLLWYCGVKVAFFIHCAVMNKNKMSPEMQYTAHQLPVNHVTMEYKFNPVRESVNVCLCEAQTHRRYSPLPSPGGLCGGISKKSLGYFPNSSNVKKDRRLRSYQLRACVRTWVCVHIN